LLLAWAQRSCRLSSLFRRNNRKTSLYLQFTFGRPLSFRYKYVINY